MARLSLVFVATLVCGLYCSAALLGIHLSGDRVVEGSLGIVLGLYTASHPAALAIDLFFLSRSSTHPQVKALVGWPSLSLHGLALILAWLAITLGAIRLGRP